MKSSSLVFGIDGGGTSSRLIVADAVDVRRAAKSGDSFEIIASCSGGSANVNSVGDDGLKRTFSSLFSRIAERGFAADAFIGGCVGAAGAGRPSEKVRVEQALIASGAPNCPIRVVPDHEIALAGGLRSDRGFLIVGGTGSIAFARAADGRFFRAGGLGHWLGDEGSAFAIAFQALSRSLRAAEGRDLPTAMLQPLLEFYGLASVEDVVPFVYSHFDKAVIARAASFVAEFRDRDDPLAVDIYNRAARDLLMLCRSVRDQSHALVDDRRILLWGGLLEQDARLRAQLSSMIRDDLVDLTPVLPRGSAVEGACILAATL